MHGRLKAYGAESVGRASKVVGAHRTVGYYFKCISEALAKRNQTEEIFVHVGHRVTQHLRAPEIVYTKKNVLQHAVFCLNR